MSQHRTPTQLQPLLLVLAAGVPLLLGTFALWVWLTTPPGLDPDAMPPSVLEPGAGESHPPPETHQGFLYGRVTTVEGAVYEGRLRWGGAEEAFWGDYFNGRKDENPWAAYVPPEQRSTESRPFMARHGDIAHIEARGIDVRVTLQSGTVFDLDRHSAGDFDDGVWVWDGSRGVVDIKAGRIRRIEFLPTPALGVAPYRVHGSVRTRKGDFTGFVQWNRGECVGSDELDGKTADGAVSLRYDTIRSIARNSQDSSLVTLLDGREFVLSDTREAGDGNRGLYVDDPRYGRVLVSWDAFERFDLTAGGSGPAYGEFSPGLALTGSVTTRAGGRLTGRLVYDLDESETTETLDAPFEGVDYTISFGLIASIVPPGRVILHDGEELQLEPAGDLGEKNAGMLIFVEGRQYPEYVPWSAIKQVDFSGGTHTRP